MTVKSHYIELAIKKALQSDCTYKVSAIGLNKKGDLVCCYSNRHKFNRYGGGEHAERLLMKNHPKSIKTIIICRVGKGGDILPIDPCPVCAKVAKSLNIKIITIR